MNIKTLAVTTTIAVSVCPSCGTIARSGKSSCCGRGGSWFKNCGGTGKKELHHTWYEGIQACKVRSQSKAVVGQKSNSVQQKHTDSSQGTAMANYKEVVPSAKMFAFTPVNASTSVSDTTSIVTPTYTPDNMSITTLAYTFMTTHKSVSTSITTPDCVDLLLLQIIVFISTFCL